MPDQWRGRNTWWVISGSDLRTALERCYMGEDPGVLMAELYANTSDLGEEDEDE